MIASIDGLISRIRDEAVELEECGSVDLACGMFAVIKLIEREVDVSAAIGGEPVADIEPEPVADMAEIARLNAEIDSVKSELARVTAKHERLMSLAAAKELTKQEISNYTRGVKMTQPKYLALVGEANKVEKKLHEQVKCKSCVGKGTVKPMYYEYDCTVCGGTGCDMSDVVTFAINQQEIIRAQTVLINSFIHDFFLHGFTSKERMAFSIDNFYSDCKTNLRLD